MWSHKANLNIGALFTAYKEYYSNYKLFISITPIQPYNNWLSKVALHIIVDFEKVRSQHIYITYRLELFEHIGFKLALHT